MPALVLVLSLATNIFMVFVLRFEPPHVSPFSLPLPAEEAPGNRVGGLPEPAEPGPQAVSAVRAALAIVLDDFGWGVAGTAEALRLPPEVSVAVLPYGPRSTQEAKAAAASGHEVLIHLPMEPLGGATTAGTGRGYFITVDMPDDRIEQLVEEYARRVPGAIALNNHMGSRASSDERVVRAVVRAAARLGLAVVDSRTIPSSKLYAIAVQAGLKAGQNQLFIDNFKERDHVKGKLLQAAALALRKQSAIIVIGHVNPVTVQAIRDTLPELERMGVGLVRLSQALQTVK